MIRNISYHKLELKQEIYDYVGRSFPLVARFKLKGIGSQRYQVLTASKKLADLFARDSAANFCNIELRTKGIMLRFRSKQETFGWLIPYRLLTVFKDGISLSLYDGRESIQLKAAQNAQLKTDFINKMIRLKAEASETSPPLNLQ